MTDDSKKPVFERRLNHIRVGVWANRNEKGTWFNTVITRRYKDGEKWIDSNTFNGLADLALAGEAQRLARDFITRAESDIESQEGIE